MHTLVARAVETICLSRDDGDWNSVDESVLSELVQEFGESDLANRLYQEIPRSVPYEVVCDIFNLLAWRTEDNGASIGRTIEDWLREGADIRKLRIALNLDVYPFISATEMDEVLSSLARKNPSLSYRCHELVKSRKRES
jgi:hypothetical protein